MNSTFNTCTNRERKTVQHWDKIRDELRGGVVGTFPHGSIKLNDVLVTQDTENLSLDEEMRKGETRGLWRASLAASLTVPISDTDEETWPLRK